MNLSLHFDDAHDAVSESFASRSARSASALQTLGLGRSDVVALMLHNEPVMLELMMATRTLGVYSCLVNWHFKAAEVGHVLRDSGAKVLIVHAHLVAQVREAFPEGLQVFVVEPAARTREAFSIPPLAAPLLPSEFASARSWQEFRDTQLRPEVPPSAPGSVMVYTSGTTGLPKGIRRAAPTPEQNAIGTAAASKALGATPGMRALLSGPIYHSGPAAYATYAALMGGELWIEPRFDAERTLALIAKHRISHAYIVPTMCHRLLRLPPEVRTRYDLSSLQYVFSTGAPFPAETKRQMIEWWGPVLYESYAASELGFVTRIDSHEAQRKPGSVGRALDMVGIKIMDAQGRELPAGEVGLIHARHAASVDFTYNNNDQARRQIEHDGLWTLKDMGYLDSEGYLYVVDRMADMVIAGGVNIYPAEIEAVLVGMPGVADCAVFGIPDDDMGESLLAVVQPTGTQAPTEDQVKAWLRERVANYKVPRQVLFQAELPREDTGKIFKRRLRDPYWAGRTRRV